MKMYATINELRAELAEHRKSGHSIGLVPTMGALHDGHLSLVRAARERAQCVAVSIFVNPTQFGPNEDFSKYPRDLAKDSEMLRRAGVDLLFTPSVDEIYGARPTAWVTVEGLEDKNEGRMRPGHFRGVATVVAKLFNIVQPNAAFFGQKDAAQLALIRAMTNALRFPIEIVGCPIVREPDGLAMSSRNVYLRPEERQRALALSRALKNAAASFRQGTRSSKEITATATAEFAAAKVEPDYIEILDPLTLDPVETIAGPTLLAVAAKIGTTRLLDNIILGQK